MFCGEKTVVIEIRHGVQEAHTTKFAIKIISGHTTQTLSHLTDNMLSFVV